MHQTFDAALEINLLHANQAGADHNREHFDEWGITCLNLMSSPGAGKTVLLEKTLAALKDQLKMANPLIIGYPRWCNSLAIKTSYSFRKARLKNV